MKIERTGRAGASLPGANVPGADVKGAARGAGPETSPGARTIKDTVSIRDIPENELTPRVHRAIMALLEEVAKLREELDVSKARLGELERLANEDPLVPISNRRAFVRELSRAISYSKRYGTPSSVLYFDLNGMKAINDSHGHAAGDAALKQVAELLVGNVRESDIVGRLGGDEFGVLLVHADEEEAERKAAMLARAISDQPAVWKGKEMRLTVAYGAHTFTGGEDPIDALAAADKAMYAHKQKSSEMAGGG